MDFSPRPGPFTGTPQVILPAISRQARPLRIVKRVSDNLPHHCEMSPHKVSCFLSLFLCFNVFLLSFLHASMFFSFLFFLLQCLFFVFSPLHFFQLKLFSVSLFLPLPNAFSHHFSFHFLSQLTMIHSITTFLPHYSLPSASLPSPSSSSLSSSLPLSAAFSFPFHVDLPPPPPPPLQPPNQTQHTQTIVKTSTTSFRALLSGRHAFASFGA